MRRILAITLLVAFGLPMLSAFASLRMSGAEGLPACCRKSGAHHCSGGRTAGDGSPVVNTVPCSRFPAVATAVRADGSAAPVLRSVAGPGDGFHALAEIRAMRFVACEAGAAHPKRGPPSADL